MSDTDPSPASPPAPAPPERCAQCKAPMSPNRPTSFCSSDCEKTYVKTHVLKPKKVVRRPQKKRRR